MNILLITFEAVFILLGIGVIGFWIIGHRHVPGITLSFLSSLALDIALPALVLANLLIDFSPDKYPDWWRFPLWWLGFTVVALVLSLTTAYIARKDIRGEFAISMFYQNGLFFPIILITGLYGIDNEYLVPLFIFMVFFPSVVFSTYPLFFKKKLDTQKLSWRRIINPVLVATLIGMIISLAAIRNYIPGFILSILAMVGAMATPLFMLILGGNVYNDFIIAGQKKKRFEIGEIIRFVLVKNILFPLIYIGLLIVLQPDYTIAFIILLQAVVPPITAIPIFADRAGGNRAITSQYIVGSFLFSLVSIPAAIYLFGLFFPLPF
jgi:malate permease and related proteins